MTETFTSPLDYPVFVDDVQPDNVKRRKRDEFIEWLNRRTQDRIQIIQEEENNEKQRFRGNT